MATVTNAETVEARQSGSTIKYLFRYTLDNGEVHERRAWVPAGTNEVDERNRRASIMLGELARAEADQIIEGV